MHARTHARTITFSVVDSRQTRKNFRIETRGPVRHQPPCVFPLEEALAGGSSGAWFARGGGGTGTSVLFIFISIRGSSFPLSWYDGLMACQWPVAPAWPLSVRFFRSFKSSTRGVAWRGRGTETKRGRARQGRSGWVPVCYCGGGAQSRFTFTLRVVRGIITSDQSGRESASRR